MTAHEPTAPGSTLLLLTAATKELAALAAAWPGVETTEEDFVVLETGGGVLLAKSGVGKVNAAIATLRLLPRHEPAGIVSIGLCGALPARDQTLAIGDIVLATASVYADEGVATPEAFKSLDEIGFPPGGRDFAGSSLAPDRVLLERLATALGGQAKRGVVATVSTCSGTDARAAEIARRTGAIAEAMEGAAVGHAAARSERGRVRFAELRVVSNTTGDRARQRWDFPLAFRRMTDVARLIGDHLR
ncbi:MAG: futalosine hydrolase [Phycisphaerales bacterium]|nr:futalosine hydrolase [Phycisphaerales bacterium]